MNTQFKDLVASTLKIDASTLNEGSNSSNTENWDSLMHWEIIGIIEQKYNIEFTMDEAIEFENLGGIYGFLIEKGILNER